MQIGLGQPGHVGDELHGGAAVSGFGEHDLRRAQDVALVFLAYCGLAGNFRRFLHAGRTPKNILTKRSEYDALY